jgi:hypothetical protein
VSHASAVHDLHSASALHSTLRYLLESDIPSQHRRILIEVVTQVLREQETARIRQLAIERVDVPWHEHEIAVLQSFLHGRIAKGWQHADELVMHLARQLNRPASDVRMKATELGFGAAVDYRVAKAAEVHD